MVGRRKTDCVAVMTADIIHSTRYAKVERQRIDRILLKAFTEVNHVYPHALETKPAFRVTAGDEFQCVFADVPESFNIVTYLRCVCATSDLKPPLVLTFILTGYPDGIGFLLAGKALVRYPEIKEDVRGHFAEYFLIGTLTSVTLALLGGLLAVKLILRL